MQPKNYEEQTINEVAGRVPEAPRVASVSHQRVQHDAAGYCRR
jgi:hypothetical protein